MAGETVSPQEKIPLNPAELAKIRKDSNFEGVHATIDNNNYGEEAREDAWEELVNEQVGLVTEDMQDLGIALNKQNSGEGGKLSQKTKAAETRVQKQMEYFLRKPSLVDDFEGYERKTGVSKVKKALFSTMLSFVSSVGFLGHDKVEVIAPAQPASVTPDTYMPPGPMSFAQDVHVSSGKIASHHREVAHKFVAGNLDTHNPSVQAAVDAIQNGAREVTLTGYFSEDGGEEKNTAHHVDLQGTQKEEEVILEAANERGVDTSPVNFVHVAGGLIKGDVDNARRVDIAVDGPIRVTPAPEVKGTAAEGVKTPAKKAKTDTKHFVLPAEGVATNEVFDRTPEKGPEQEQNPFKEPKRTKLPKEIPLEPPEPPKPPEPPEPPQPPEPPKPPRPRPPRPPKPRPEETARAAAHELSKEKPKNTSGKDWGHGVTRGSRSGKGGTWNSRTN